MRMNCLNIDVRLEKCISEALLMFGYKDRHTIDIHTECTIKIYPINI